MLMVKIVKYLVAFFNSWTSDEKLTFTLYLGLFIASLIMGQLKIPDPIIVGTIFGVLLATLGKFIKSPLKVSKNEKNSEEVANDHH